MQGLSRTLISPRVVGNGVQLWQLISSCNTKDATKDPATKTNPSLNAYGAKVHWTLGTSFCFFDASFQEMTLMNASPFL